MNEHHEADREPQAALEAARADAARRIAELRRSTELSAAPALPDLRSVLSRAEDHVSELRDTAADLKAVLPTRVEAAISRALAGSEGTPLGRQVEDLRRLALETTAAMDSLAGDVHGDQIGRVEDLETMVDLIAASTTAVRGDVARLESELAETRTALADVVGGLAELTGAVARLSAKLDRPMSMTLVPEASPIPSAPSPAWERRADGETRGELHQESPPASADAKRETDRPAVPRRAAGREWWSADRSGHRGR